MFGDVIQSDQTTTAGSGNALAMTYVMYKVGELFF